MKVARHRAAAFAVVLARFWEISRIIHGSIARPDQLLAGDLTFPACIIQTTKILLIAKQNHILSNPSEHGRVPPFLGAPWTNLPSMNSLNRTWPFWIRTIGSCPRIEEMVGGNISPLFISFFLVSDETRLIYRR